MSNRVPWSLCSSLMIQPLSWPMDKLGLVTLSLVTSERQVNDAALGVFLSRCFLTPLKQPLSEYNGLLRYFFLLLRRLSVGVFFPPSIALHQNWWDLCSRLVRNEEIACIITEKQSLKNKSRSAMGDPQRRGSSVALHNCQVMIRSL